jgi:hypothetical protein
MEKKMIGRNRLKAKIARRAWREYMQFKRDMFHRKKRELWENCQKIHFYCCVMEYFHYRRESSHDWAALIYCKQPIKAMWDCYQQNEHLEYSTWKDVEEILYELERQNTGKWKEWKRCG